MNFTIIRNAMMFVALLLTQAAVLNHIHIFDYITPMLYAYFIIRMRRDVPRWAILIWCFALGLCADILTNTPGVGAASMTLAGLVQPYLLKLFVTQESAEDLRPSFATLGTAKYVSYASTLVFIHCLTFFALEAFNFFAWQQWLIATFGSTLLSTVLILAVENVRTSGKP